MSNVKRKWIPVMMAAALTAGSVPVASVEAEETKQYIINMNVSYHDFYGAYGIDTTKGVSDTVNYVDAVTSATLNKYKMNTENGLNAGTYNSLSQDGTVGYINGVTLPVVVDESEKAVLIGSGTYQEEQFMEMKTKPAAYLEADVTADGKVSYTLPTDATSATLRNISASFTAESRYGDYQLDLSGEEFDANLKAGTAIVYGVILNTKEGDKYGMYSQENIWRNSEIAWSVGGVTEVHGCPLRSDVYKTTIGQTITDLTYITNKGTFVCDIPDQKVGEKTNMKMTAENAVVATDTKIKVTLTDMAADYEPEFSMVTKDANIKVTNTEKVSTDGVVYDITVSNLVPGNYTIQVKDKKDKYTGVSANVLVTGSKISVVNNQITLNPVLGADNITNFVKNISEVTVTTGSGVAVKYLPEKSGRQNLYVANIFDTEGKLNTEATYDYVEAIAQGRQVTYNTLYTGNIFAEDGTYNIEVISLGYDKVVFTYVKGQSPSTEKLAKPVNPVGTTKTIKNIKYKVTKNTNATKTVTITGVSKKTLKTITIPATVKINNQTFKVTAIANKAFQGCTKATSVTIGKNITKIGKQAFSGDKAVKKITILSKNVKSIGSKAFANIPKSAKLIVPSGKKSAYKKLARNAGFKGSVK